MSSPSQQERPRGDEDGGGQRDPSDVIEAGALVGRQYRIVKRLGRGGMGDIYLASDEGLDRLVAVKFLRPRETAMLESDARFRREARLLSRLNHPNVVTIHAFGTIEPDTKYIVMEYVAGQGLDAVLEREGPLDPDAFAHVMAQVCSAVAEAHRHGIVHRDLKPGNVIVTNVAGDPRYVKVLDFGLAKVFEAQQLAGADADDVSRAGICVGTPIYMSPEQARGVTHVDGRSDVYSLAIMGCQLLTGRLPLEGADARRQILAHILDTPALPSRLRPELGIPPELDRVFERALAKEPGDRYQTADAFVAALLDAVRSWQGVTRGPEAPARERPRPPRMPDPPPRPRRGELSDTDPDLAPTMSIVTPTPVSAAAPAAEQRVAERTVLCVRLQITPPEDTDLLEEYLESLAVVASKLQVATTTYGGFHVGPLTDRPVLLFGGQGSEGAPVEQALDAALAIRTALGSLRGDPSLPPGFQEGFAFGIGVDRGRVAVANFGELGPAVHGAALDRARAMADACPAGAVWLGDALLGRVRGLFDVEPVRAEGRRVWELRGKGALAGFEAGGELRAVATRMVGREVEREELHSVLCEVVALSEPRVVVVSGPPGVGKARLVGEFVRDVADLPESYGLDVGRCVPWRDGSPYQPVVDAIRRRAHIETGDTPARARRKLERFVRGYAADDPQELDELELRMLGQLEELLGIASGPPRMTVQGDEAARTLLLDAVALLWRRLCERGPQILVVTQFEQASASTRALMSHLLARVGQAPLMIVLVGHRSGRDRFDTSFFRDRSAALHLTLAPLEPDAMVDHVRELLTPAGDVPAALVAEIVRVSDGRPVVADEIAHLMIDRGVIVADERGWRASRGALGRFRVPGSLEEVVSGRLAQLPPHLTPALEVAAVAETFWPAMVAELAGGSVHPEAFFELSRRGLLVERREHVISGEHDYAFAREEFRAAVEAAVEPARAREIHAGVADWLQARSGPRVAPLDGRIAHHRLRAGDRRGAFEALLSAGRRSVRLQARESAIELLEEAFQAVRSASSSDRSGRLEALEIAAEAARQMVLGGRQQLAVTLAADALSGTRGAANEEQAIGARVALWMGRALDSQGYAERAASAFRAAERMVEAGGVEGELAIEVRTELAISVGRGGDIDRAARLLRQALDAPRRSAPEELSARATASCELANALFRLGDFEQAEALYREAYQLARSASDPAGMADALGDYARLQRYRGDGDEAETAWRQGLAVAERWDLLRRRADFTTRIGELELERGAVEDALTTLLEAEDLHDYLASDEGIADAGRLLAETELALGRPRAAKKAGLRALQAAEALADATTLGLVHRTLGLVFHALSRESGDDPRHREASRRHFRAAVEAFEAGGLTLEVAATRELRARLGAA